MRDFTTGNIPPIEVEYSPPRQARRLPAQLHLGSAEPTALIVRTEDGETFTCPQGSFRILPPVGQTERLIRFNDGSSCRVHRDQEAAFSALETVFQPRGIQDWVHRLERSLKWIAVASVCTLLIAWAGYRYGLPAVANHLARQASPEVREFVSQQSIKLMDGRFMGPTELSAEDQATLQRLTDEIQEKLGPNHRLKLETRESRVGPNAFALPDGTIVFTDELFELLDSEEQMLAVLAHEAGHVEAQHGMRLVLQNAGIALVATVVVGDVSSWGGIGTALPSMLAQNAYSRDFETEADLYAARFLVENGYDLSAMKDALLRLHEGREGLPAEDLLSTHPSLQARLDALDAYAAELGLSATSDD